MKEGFVTHRTPAKVRRVQMISSQCHFSPTKQMAKRAVKTGLVKKRGHVIGIIYQISQKRLPTTNAGVSIRNVTWIP